MSSDEENEVVAKKKKPIKAVKVVEYLTTEQIRLFRSFNLVVILLPAEGFRLNTNLEFINATTLSPIFGTFNEGAAWWFRRVIEKDGETKLVNLEVNENGASFTFHNATITK